jgi:hypothetical protein
MVAASSPDAGEDFQKITHSLKKRHPGQDPWIQELCTLVVRSGPFTLTSLVDRARESPELLRSGM